MQPESLKITVRHGRRMTLRICPALVPMVMLFAGVLDGLASPPRLAEDNQKTPDTLRETAPNSGSGANGLSVEEEQAQPTSSSDDKEEAKKSPSVVADSGDPLAGFSRVKIAATFSDVVSRGDLLLESGGGKIIDMPDGSRWVLGIGIASVNPQGGGAEIIRQRTVAEQRARKAIVSEFESSSVQSTTTATSTTMVVTSDGAEVAASSDQLKEQIRSEVEGILKELKQAGSWYSPDGQLFYLALCVKVR